MTYCSGARHPLPPPPLIALLMQYLHQRLHILPPFPHWNFLWDWDLVYVIAWARGQLRINFTRIFKGFTKLPESRSDEGNLENFENTSEINP